jgi:hypothetical protein
MGFFQFIQNVQRKPQHERRFLLWASTVSIMTAIVFVWVTARGGLIPVAGSNPNLADSSASANTISPLESIKEMFSVIGDDVARGFDVVKSSFSDDISDQSATQDPSAVSTETGVMAETILLPDRSFVSSSTSVTPSAVKGFIQVASSSEGDAGGGDL